jgi:integrase
MKEFCIYVDESLPFSPKLTSEFITYIMNRDEGFSTTGQHSKKHMYYLRTMRKFEDFSTFGTFFRTKKDTPEMVWPASFKKELDAFFLSKAKDISPGQINRIRLRMKDFLLYLERISISSFNQVTYHHLSKYITSLVGYAPVTVSSELSCLRVAFRYLYLNQYIKVPLHELLPKSRQVYRTRIPNVWSEQELQQIKDSVDLCSPVGKRDYAIIMLAAGTGLRGGDIADLKLSDFDWTRKEISIIQNKTGKNITLPIMDDVGWALIDYLKNARPSCDSNRFFLRLNYPFEPYADGSALYRIITKYISKAGISVEGREKNGIHSLRHTLANTLLQYSVDIMTIATILGHDDPESTLHYLRSNMELLSRCPLEVMSDDE